MAESKVGSKRSRSEANVAKVPVDEDLVCAICIDLVNDARQVTCCGSLFCKTCIEQCQRRCGHAVCPNCRSVLLSSNILVDKRSERKSAEHLRNCTYHEDYYCSFIGNRSAVLKHQLICDCNPSLCKNENCRKLFIQESERVQAAANQDLALKKQLVATAWQAPEETLRSVFNLNRVEFFRAAQGPVQDYQLAFMWANTYYICTLSVAHHNVSITCNSAGFARQSDLKAKCVLIHPTDPSLNRSVEIFVPAADSDADEDDEDYADYEDEDEQDEGNSDENSDAGGGGNGEIEVIDCTSDTDDADEEGDEDDSARSSDDEDTPALVAYTGRAGNAGVAVYGHDSEEDDDDDEQDDFSQDDSEDEEDEEEEEGEEEEVHGEANWMTEREFHMFVKNGKFALGVETSAYA